MTSIAKLKKRWLKDPKVNEAFKKMRSEFLKHKRQTAIKPAIIGDKMKERWNSLDKKVKIWVLAGVAVLVVVAAIWG